MNEDVMVSEESAKEIAEYLHGSGCIIDSEGRITNTKQLHLYTHELGVWLNKYDAHFWICGGQLQISNWPRLESKPLPPGEYTCKVTTTQAVSNTRAEGLVAAVITEGEYKGRTIPIKLQSEDC